MSRRKLEDIIDKYEHADGEAAGVKSKKRLKRLRFVLFVLLMHCVCSDVDDESKEADLQNTSTTTTQPETELDLTGAAVMTERVDIPDTTIADAIDRIKAFNHMKGTSDGHRLQLLSVPPNDIKSWTTSFCGVGKCSEKLVRSVRLF